MTSLDIAREVFPGESDEFLDHVLWERTGFPCFFPRRYKSVETAIRSQLKAFRKAAERLKPGERLCDHCNSKAKPDTRWPACRRCERILESEPPAPSKETHG